MIEEYRKEIRENIEYDHLRRQHPYDDIDEIADLMLEVLCTQGSFMRIGGKQLYTALVKERFLKLDSSHIEYVLDCLRRAPRTFVTSKPICWRCCSTPQLPAAATTAPK